VNGKTSSSAAAQPVELPPEALQGMIRQLAPYAGTLPFSNVRVLSGLIGQQQQVNPGVGLLPLPQCLLLYGAQLAPAACCQYSIMRLPLTAPSTLHPFQYQIPSGGGYGWVGGGGVGMGGSMSGLIHGWVVGGRLYPPIPIRMGGFWVGNVYVYLQCTPDIMR
jgi:hypothetical protein